MYEEVLAGADALIFGTPTRYGMMTAEMRTVLDGLRRAMEPETPS